MPENERKDGYSSPLQGPGNGSGLGSEDDLAEDALMMEQMRTDHPCRGCRHWGGRLYRTCNYIFNTGHSRPCEPGCGCTVKEHGTAAQTEPWWYAK